MAGKSELAEQTKIVKSARTLGGYGRKMSNRFTIGIPDLLLVVPGFVPGIFECKDLGEVRRWPRMVDVTEKQGIELREFDLGCKVTEAGEHHLACGILVTFTVNGLRRLMLTPHHVRVIEARDEYPTVARELGGFYPLTGLFHEAGISRWPGRN